MIDIQDLTIKQINQLKNMFSIDSPSTIDNFYKGKYVIIRTYSAGVHFGILKEKSGNEVILEKSRRMWFWKSKESISLSGVANYGIDEDKSKIASELETIWLETIEIIPCSDKCIKSIRDCKNAQAE